MAEVVVVGCINLDQVAFVSRLPEPGETVLSADFETHLGGKGANQAAQVALLMQDKGAPAVRVEEVELHAERKESSGSEQQQQQKQKRVAIIGRVGMDDAGDRFLKHFASLCIDTRGLTADSHKPTGSALVTVAANGENTIAYMPGANATLASDHLRRDSALTLLRNAKVVLSENGVPAAVSIAAFKEAKDANAVTVFTPSPVESFNAEICCFTDYLLCNACEAKAIMQKLGATLNLEEGENEQLLAKLLHEKALEAAGRFACKQRGHANVVITRGSQPCIVYANGKASVVALEEEIQKELVKDTTGAGDSFAGAFAYFLLMNFNKPEEAVSRATFVAAQSVKKKGAAVSYACRHDLPERLFSG
ncbi:hypothetical protein Efla_007303 [Eimeria flavescens]